MADKPVPRRSWRRRAIIAVAVLVLLVVGAVAALPLLVDSDAARRAIQRRISAVAGGEVSYDSLAIRLFPQPRADLRGASLRVADAVDGRVDEIRIGIALLPLLAGNVRPTSIRLAQPALAVRIDPTGGSAGDPMAAYRAAMGPVVDGLVREAQGMSLEIVGGRLDIVYAGRPLLALSALAGEADVGADAIDASVSAASDLWRGAKGRAKVAAGSLAATAKLELSGLESEKVIGALGDARIPPRSIRAAGDVVVDAETDGKSTLRAKIAVSAPQLALARGERTLEVGAVRVALDAARNAEALTVALGALQLGELVPHATGSLRAQPDGAAPTVELRMPALDLQRVRTAALALADDLEPVRVAAATLKAGQVRDLALAASGTDFSVLAEPRSVRGTARLEAAALAFPDIGIDVTNGTGRFELDAGAARGSELAGDIGRSSFRDGTLAAELAPAASLRSLDAAVDADLAEVLAIVRRAAGKAAVADIESLQGRASGRFAYAPSRQHAGFSVDAASVRATGRYRGVPFPLAVTQGAVRYTHDRVVVRDLAGTIGGSRLQGGAAEIALGEKAVVRAASGDAVLALDEIYPWLASRDGLRTALAGVKSVTGSAAVRLVRVSGPLADPAALDFEATVRPTQVRVTADELPAQLALTGGEAGVAGRTLRLDGVAASLLDAKVIASGTVQEYASPDRRIDLTLADGTAGAQATDWVHMRWKLAPDAKLRAPIGLSKGRVQWSNGALDAQGAVTFPADAGVELDFAVHPGGGDLRRLALKDADSDAVVSLKWSAAAAEVGFRGYVSNRTLARILANPPDVEGSLRGEFRASVDLREPRRSTAVGKLEGDGIYALERLGLPVVIDRLRLAAAGDTVRIEESALRVAGERLTVTGTVARKPDTFGIDGRVTADNVDAVRLVEALRPPADLSRRPFGAAWDLPVDGRVAVAVGSLAYGKHVFRPVAATVSLAPNRVVAQVTDAQLCGVSLPLTAVLAPRSVTVTGKIHSRGQALDQTATCLTGANIMLTGTLDFDGEFTASGPLEGLLEAVRGSFSAVATDGRIQRAPAITRILLMDNVASLLRAGPSELMAGGMAYSRIAASGTIEGPRISVSSGTLDSPSIGIAMTGDIDLVTEQVSMRGLAAPFNYVHTVLRNVPIVGRLFGRRLVGIPVSVTGDMRDPTVLPLGAQAVGDGLVNLLSATFQAPIDLLDPLFNFPRRGEAADKP